MDIVDGRAKLLYVGISQCGQSCRTGNSNLHFICSVTDCYCNDKYNICLPNTACIRSV